MRTFRRLLPFALSLLFFAACSEEDPSQVRHHFNPLWTPDGKTFVAGFFEAPTSSLGASLPPSTRLAVYSMETRSVRIVDLGTAVTLHRLYAFDPSGTALALIDGSVRFFDLQGTPLLTWTPSDGSDPKLLVFTNSGNSFLWAGKTDSGVDIGLSTYDPTTWAVLDEFVLHSLPGDSEPLALSTTSQRSYAIRFADGRVEEMDFNGTSLNSFVTEHFETDNPWHYRLTIFNAGGMKFLYTIDKGGILRLNLGTGLPERLISGSVVDIDVSDSRRSMLLETRTGDTWITDPDGSPLDRFAGLLMPRISPASNGIAFVKRIDDFTDSLQVMLLRQ